MQKNWELTSKTEPTPTPRDFGCQTETSKISYRIVCCCFQNEYFPYSEKGCGGELLLYVIGSWHHNIHVTIKSQLKVIKLRNPNLLQVCISSLLPLYHFSHRHCLILQSSSSEDFTSFISSHMKSLAVRQSNHLLEANRCTKLSRRQKLLMLFWNG